MKPTKYSNFCLKVFGRFFEKYMKDQLEEKNLELVKADIQMSYEEFYSITLMNTILGYIVSVIILGILHAIISSDTTFLLAVFLPVLITLGIGFGYLYYPKYKIIQRGKNIDLFLPYAINFISSMAVAGISPAEIFQTLAAITVYGEVQNEAKKVAKEIAIMGTDNITAIKNVIEITPSKKFKAFLQGIVGTIQSGSELHIYLGEVARRYMDEDLVDRKRDLDLLAIIAEVLVLAVIAFPILLVIILTVMGFFGGSTTGSLTILLFFSFVALPMIYVMFYLLIKSTSIERLTRVDFKIMDIKEYIRENKNFLLTILISTIAVVNLYVIVFLLGKAGYYDFNFYTIWDFAFIAFLIFITPAGMYKYLELKKKKEMQQRLPEFLNEVGDSLATGMNIFDSIKKAAKGNYGKLSPEIETMKNQLSWKITMKQVLFDFAKRMKTAIVYRIIIVVDKALMMGGNTPKIFKAAANEVEQVNEIEYQRKNIMSIYALVILVCFFVFLGILLILDRSIFEQFFIIQAKQISNAPGALTISNLSKDVLNYTLYSFVFVQSIGAGFLAGFMMDGKLSSGIRWAVALSIISIVIFKFII